MKAFFILLSILAFEHHRVHILLTVYHVAITACRHVPFSSLRAGDDCGFLSGLFEQAEKSIRVFY